jgi:hypothetical protein
VRSSGLLLSFKLFENQMEGKKNLSRRDHSAKAGNFAARAAPGLDIRRGIVYFSYFT